MIIRTKYLLWMFCTQYFVEEKIKKFGFISKRFD